jgi:hypothetical protein
VSEQLIGNGGDDTKMIPCKDIDIPALDKKSRTFRKDFCQNLAVSIREEGLHQPIGVRPKGKRYELVFGRHRLTAVKNILKWELIPAHVRTLDDTESELAKTAENLWRQELTGAQRLIEVKKWWDLYAAKHPEKVGKGAAGSIAAAAAREAKKTAEQPEPSAEVTAAQPEEPSAATVAAEPIVDAVENVDTVDAVEPAKDVPSFPKVLASITGQSEASAKRETRISKAFTPEELIVMEASNISQADMLTMAKIKDQKQRSEVAGLMYGQGLTLAEAMGNVLGSDAPTPEDGKSKATREAKSKAKAEVAPEQTDEEWFETHCSEKAALLAEPTKYRFDAFLWRWTNDARHQFRAKAKPYLDKHRKAMPGGFGPYGNLINRIISASHPKDWMLCDKCAAKGHVNGDRCGKCSGGGYLIKVETYL